MKLSRSFLVFLLCLFQNVKRVQSAALLQNDDGESTPLGNLICFVIPCVDEEYGWRNVFGPVAADRDPVDGSVTQFEPIVIPEEEQPLVREQIGELALDIFQALRGNNQQEAGTPIDTVPTEDIPLVREQIQSLALNVFQIIRGSSQGQNGGTRRRRLRGYVEKDLTKKEMHGIKGHVIHMMQDIHI